MIMSKKSTILKRVSTLFRMDHTWYRQKGDTDASVPFMLWVTTHIRGFVDQINPSLGIGAIGIRSARVRVFELK
jgi:hypothetical protein